MDITWLDGAGGDGAVLALALFRQQVQRLHVLLQARALLRLLHHTLSLSSLQFSEYSDSALAK